MFFDTTRESGDPQYVDVILADTERGNSTTLFARHDLERTPDAGFPLPEVIPHGTGYIVRMVDATSSERRVLATSPAFQVYAAGTPPSSSYSSSTADTTTGVVLTQSAPTSSSTSPAQASTTAETIHKLPVAAIAGGVVGGVALLVLFFVLLYCIRKQGRPLTPEELEKKKKLKEKDIISPFIIQQSTSEQAPSNGGTTGSPTIASGPVNAHHPSDARAEKARLAMLANNANRNFFTPGAIERLPTELTANSTIGDSMNSASSVSTNDTSNPLVGAHRRKVSKSKIAEELRRERERLDKQIAELERRTSVGGSRAAAVRRNNTDNDEMLAELAALREQMTVVQSRVPNEPPPDYYPASIAGHSSRH
ncbi:hypothetical protein EST38_g8324 [Candolleomyces aberdarensis]|uniref:Mid2 domain-containing protein n=1 Tax=Candolleomyces aberdarensis TaxID=2316362 RepID=A0A4Q2DCR8_9AGAR|nr:hypothetical protein EST38_g8324 [Candolleomyces aberdarensis]